MRMNTKRTNVLALALSVAFVTGCGGETAKGPAATPVVSEAPKVDPKSKHPATQPLVNVDPKPVVAHAQPADMPASQSMPRSEEPEVVAPEAPSARKEESPKQEEKKQDEPQQSQPAPDVKQESQKPAEKPVSTPEFVRPTGNTTKTNPNKPKVLFTRNESTNDWDATNASGFTNTTHFAMPEFTKHQPAADDTIIQQPGVEDIKVEEPVVQQPVVEEPVVQDPVDAQEPVVETPVFAEPTITTPVVDDAAEVEPVTASKVDEVDETSALPLMPESPIFKLTDREAGYVWLETNAQEMEKSQLDLQESDIYVRCDAPDFEPVHMIASAEYFESWTQSNGLNPVKGVFKWNQDGIEFKCWTYTGEK